MLPYLDARVSCLAGGWRRRWQQWRHLETAVAAAAAGSVALAGHLETAVAAAAGLVALVGRLETAVAAAAGSVALAERLETAVAVAAGSVALLAVLAS